MEAGMRAVVVAVVVGVVFPGVALAQLAPASQAEFEQRFTGWTLLSDAPDCNEGNGIDPVTFIGPGRFETNGLEGDYQYRGTGADTGTLTLTVDILPIPLVSDLTFDSRTTGTFAAGAGGVVLCEGGFELVDSTIPDTTPPSLVGAEVAVSGDEMALAFGRGARRGRLPSRPARIGALRHRGRGTRTRRRVRLRGLRAHRPSPAALPVQRHHPGSDGRSLLRRSHPRRRRRRTPRPGRQ